MIYRGDSAGIAQMITVAPFLYSLAGIWDSHVFVNRSSHPYRRRRMPSPLRVLSCVHGNANQLFKASWKPAQVLCLCIGR